jgi:hypothetical protein
MSTLEFIVLIGASLSAILFIGNKFVTLFKTWFKFVDDWNGTEDKPGVVDRLADGNARFEKIESEISIIKAELFNNHGTSLRDAIDRIEEAVAKKPRKKTERI